MEVTAHLHNLRISPRKVRLVADMLRGISVPAARAQLSFLPKRSALPILKLLNSAAANAKHNAQLDPDGMYISRIFVNEGVTLKRGMPKSHGRVFGIKKHASHITLTLSEKKGKGSTVELSDKKPKGVASEQASGVEQPAGKTKKRLTGLARRAFTKH